jgi:hypothetical protein
MTASSGLSACIITTQNIESFLEDQHHKTITIPVAPLHKSYHAKIGLIVIVKMVFSQDYLSVVPIFLVIVTPVVVANVPRNRRQSPGNLVNRDLLYRAISVAISVRCARYWVQRLPIRDLSGSRRTRSFFPSRKPDSSCRLWNAQFSAWSDSGAPPAVMCPQA